jgi:hypothetical protein
MTLMAALAARRGCTFTILSEIAGIARRATAAMTALAALASGFHRASAIVSEIAGTLLSADMPGARRLLTIKCEVAAIGDGSRFRHGLLPVFHVVQERKREERVALPLGQHTAAAYDDNADPR